MFLNQTSKEVRASLVKTPSVETTNVRKYFIIINKKIKLIVIINIYLVKDRSRIEDTLLATTREEPDFSKFNGCKKHLRCIRILMKMIRSNTVYSLLSLQVCENYHHYKNRT